MRYTTEIYDKALSGHWREQVSWPTTGVRCSRFNIFIGIITVIGFFEPFPYLDALVWLQLSLRSFAFAFLALTYYFSKKSAQKSRIWWNIALSVLIVALLVSSAIVLVIPQFGVSAERVSGAYTRVFNVLCLAFITAYTVRSYSKKHDPAKSLGEVHWVIFNLQ